MCSGAGYAIKACMMRGLRVHGSCQHPEAHAITMHSNCKRTTCAPRTPPSKHQRMIGCRAAAKQTLTAYRRLSPMSMHRKTLPHAPRPRYLITTYWFTKVQPPSLANFRLPVSLHHKADTSSICLASLGLGPQSFSKQVLQTSSKRTIRRMTSGVKHAKWAEAGRACSKLCLCLADTTSKVT